MSNVESRRCSFIVPHRCPQCDIQFCSHCHQSPFHYRLSCAEVPEARRCSQSVLLLSILKCAFCLLQVQPTTAMYHRWALTDRARYFQRYFDPESLSCCMLHEFICGALHIRFKAITLAESKFKAETAAAKARADEAKWDEQWKKDNCKLCPHCGKVVNRVDGWVFFVSYASVLHCR